MFRFSDKTITILKTADIQRQLRGNDRISVEDLDMAMTLDGSCAMIQEIRRLEKWEAEINQWIKKEAEAISIRGWEKAYANSLEEKILELAKKIEQTQK